MLNLDVLGHQPFLAGPNVEPRQLDESCFEPSRKALLDEESIRFTHTHARFAAEQIREWLKTRPGQQDRADRAIFRIADGEYLGEVVLKDLDDPDEAMNFRSIVMSVLATDRPLP
jgi:hypothetical protein